MQPMTTGPRRKAVRDGRRSEAAGHHSREARISVPRTPVAVQRDLAFIEHLRVARNEG